MKENYFSQYKQDKFLDDVLFFKKEKGFYIDIGAHDGVTISNSLFFEKYRNWNGICIEPNPKVYQKLIKNRKSTNLNVCIGDENKNVKFTQIEGYSEMLSGITANYDLRHIKRIDKELEQKGGKRSEIEIQMIKLNDVQITKNKIIDFISIDTEGNEFNILKSIEFNKIEVNAIVVENNYKDLKIRNYLMNNGYKFIINLDSDDVYLKEELYSYRIMFRLFWWKIKNQFK